MLAVKETSLLELEREIGENTRNGEQSAAQLSDVSVHSSSRPSVKLPKLYINKYDGEIVFWDQFETEPDSS